MGCECGKAKEWLLGYAGAFCASRRENIAVVPLFVYPLAESFGEADDPPTLQRIPCPPQCAQTECDQTYLDFQPLFDACLDNTCRAQVQAAYEAAIAACTPVQ